MGLLKTVFFNLFNKSESLSSVTPEAELISFEEVIVKDEEQNVVFVEPSTEQVSTKVTYTANERARLRHLGYF